MHSGKLHVSVLCGTRARGYISLLPMSGSPCPCSLSFRAVAAPMKPPVPVTRTTMESVLSALAGAQESLAAAASIGMYADCRAAQ